MSRFSRQLAAVGSVAVAAVVVAGASSGGDLELRRSSAVEIAGKVTIAVSLSLNQQGTFSVRGAISDTGLARGRQDVATNRVRMTLTLDGRAGRIKLLVTQTCGKTTSTWSVLEGTGPYKGLTGRGTGRGRLTCAKKALHRGVYAGTVRTPPPTAVAQPGTYRGTGFSPNLRVEFEVLPDGRTVTNISFRQIVARCRPPAVEFLQPRFTGRYSLSNSGRFSFVADGYAIVGRISAGSAKGTIAYDAHGCVQVLTWKATTPAAPLPAVSPGRYCGFALAGWGVCLDATSDAWVTNVRFKPTLRCFEPVAATFTFEYVHGGAIALLPDLTFSGSLSNIPLEGGGSLRFTVSGKFEEGGRVTGRGGISSVSIVRDGTRYRCRFAVSDFSAKLGA